MFCICALLLEKFRKCEVDNDGNGTFSSVGIKLHRDETNIYHGR